MASISGGRDGLLQLVENAVVALASLAPRRILERGAALASVHLEVHQEPRVQAAVLHAAIAQQRDGRAWDLDHRGVAALELQRLGVHRELAGMGVVLRGYLARIAGIGVP